MLSRAIKDKVEHKYGSTVRYPVECDALAEEISKTTGRSISSSTIKRLWGFIEGASAARSYTLDTVAEYCGHSCFDDLIESFNPTDYVKKAPITFLLTKDIPVGREIFFTFGGEASLNMKLDENHSYRVLESNNCELVAGDVFECVKIEVGLPVFIYNWHRGTEHIGSTVLAKLTGVISISMTPLT